MSGASFSKASDYALLFMVSRETISWNLPKVWILDSSTAENHMVPRKPHPFNGQTGIALPEPEPGDR
jgi:hypothetical protein